MQVRRKRTDSVYEERVAVAAGKPGRLYEEAWGVMERGAAG